MRCHRIVNLSKLVSFSFIIMLFSNVVVANNEAFNMQLPSAWNKFGAILQVRYDHPQTKMKLSKAQLNSFISFLKNLKQPAPELLKLQAILPKTTLELMRAIESRGVTLAEAEKMAAYLQYRTSKIFD